MTEPLPQPATWRAILRKALLRTAIIALSSLLLGVVTQSNLLGPLSVFVRQIQQDFVINQVTQRLYRFGSRPAYITAPRVVLIDLDSASVQRLSPNGYLFNRARTAQILEYAKRYQPSAVFVDLDLEQGSNDNGQLSPTDQRLQTVIRQIKYPLLLPNKRILDTEFSSLSANLTEVNPNVLSAADGVARWIPSSRAEDVLPASVALFCAGLGLDVQTQTARAACLVRAGLSENATTQNRIVFHQIKRRQDGQIPVQLWKGFDVIPAVEFLNGAYPVVAETQKTIFLIGRSDPASNDFFLTPVDKGGGGGIPGVDIHVHSLMNLITYQHFLEQSNPVVLFIILPITFFVALLLTYYLTDRLFLGFVVRNKESKNIVKQWWLKRLDGLEGWLIATVLFFAAIGIAYWFGYFLDFALPVIAFQYVMSWSIWRKIN